MISVIVPTFNRALILKKAVTSILSQTYQDFELIVVDDGSSDNTRDLVVHLSDRITYIRQENRGPAAARNLGIKKSSRPFLAFLDSDDWWDREKLATQLREMQEHPKYLISHTEEIWYKDGRLLNQKKRHKKFHGDIFDKCLAMCCVSMSTAMVRRGLFDKIGLFDEDLLCCEDYDFWLRTSARFPFLLIDKPLTLKDGGRRDQVSYIYRTGIDRFRIQSILKLLKSNLLDEKKRRLATRELHKKCRIYGTGCLKHGRVDEASRYLSLTTAQ